MGEIDDFFNEDKDSSESTIELSPSNMDSSSFKLRNDTEELLLRIKLHLLNAYKEIVRQIDPDTKEERLIYKIRRIKGTKPICNKQGLAELLCLIENYVNGHTVQTNYPSKDDFLKDIKYINENIICECVMNREKWGLTSETLYSITSRIPDLVSLFLRRGIENKERESYNETNKETTHRELSDKKTQTFADKLQSMLGGKK